MSPTSKHSPPGVKRCPYYPVGEGVFISSWAVWRSWPSSCLCSFCRYLRRADSLLITWCWFSGGGRERRERRERSGDWGRNLYDRLQSVPLMFKWQFMTYEQPSVWVFWQCRPAEVMSPLAWSWFLLAGTGGEFGACTEHSWVKR